MRTRLNLSYYGTKSGTNLLTIRFFSHCLNYQEVMTLIHLITFNERLQSLPIYLEFLVILKIKYLYSFTWKHLL